MVQGRARVYGSQSRRAAACGFDRFGLKTGAWQVVLRLAEGFRGFFHKTTTEAGLTGLGLKTGVSVVWPQNHPGGRFPGLGLKTGGGLVRPCDWCGQVVPDRRTRGAITKLASRLSEVVKGARPSDASPKSWSKMPLGGLVS